MVIFRALKDKRMVLVLRKGYNTWIGGEISWKGMWAMRAFVAGKGSVQFLGSKVNGERVQHRWNHCTCTLPLYPCGQRVFFCTFTLQAHCIGTLLGSVASWLPYNDSRKWPNTESLSLTSLLRTMRSHTLQSDWSARHSPSQWWLLGLRYHNVPLCPSTCVSGCWGWPWYNFLTPDTSVCLILGSGDSGAWCFFPWPSGFPSVTFILWLICPLSTLLPVPSLYEPLPKSFDSKSVPQSRLVISTCDHPRPRGGLWGA